MQNVLISLLLILVVSQKSFSQRTEFSGSNAEAVLRTLVLDIGPRPMGSPAERRALEFAVSKFNEYGCDTSYILPFTVAQGVNTKSGVAVGVKKGKTGRIIVIGGHIDSSGPDIPGANDNGSGTACVIELARVIAKRETESTVLFCCWGGEETGLNGSKYFVDNYPLIDSVALMLQIDMADGASYLIADIDGERSNGPAWLLKAAFDEFYNTLQYEGLVYQTVAASLNTAVGGAFGSDHIPFINKGIPAIDFTSDVSFPIHTPLDNWENFTPSGLQRSGDLVLRLFERFDGGVPSRETEQYQVIQLGSTPVVISVPVLWTLIGLSLVFAVVVFVIVRKRRVVPDPSTKVRWSVFKILLGWFGLQTVAWGSESFLGVFTGYRFGWVGNGWEYVAFGTLAGIAGLWLLLRVERRFRLTADAFVYERFALIAFVVLTILASISTPRLGVLFAVALVLFSLAFLFRAALLKLLFLLAGSAVMLRLIFFEGQTLIQRGVTQSTQVTLLARFVPEILPIVFCGFFTLPLVYAFAAVYRETGKDLFLLRRFRSRGVLAASVAGLVICGGYLYTRTPYHDLWHSTVRVEQKLSAGSDSVTIEIRGSEQLRNLTSVIEGRDTLIDVGSHIIELSRAVPGAAPWLTVTNSSSPPDRTSDTTLTLKRELQLHMAARPLRVEVNFRSDYPFEITSEWAQDTRVRRGQEKAKDKLKRFVWYAFPDSFLSIPVTITCADSQLVTQEVTAMFDTLVYPVNLKREFTTVSYRTVVTAKDSFFTDVMKIEGGRH